MSGILSAVARNATPAPGTIDDGTTGTVVRADSLVVAKRATQPELLGRTINVPSSLGSSTRLSCMVSGNAVRAFSLTSGRRSMIASIGQRKTHGQHLPFSRTRSKSLK